MNFYIVIVRDGSGHLPQLGYWEPADSPCLSLVLSEACSCKKSFSFPLSPTQLLIGGYLTDGVVSVQLLYGLTLHIKLQVVIWHNMNKTHEVFTDFSSPFDNVSEVNVTNFLWK